MKHVASERWRGGLTKSGAARTPPLAVGDVFDVPGFEFLLQPVYWLVLAVDEWSMVVVAIDRGAGCGDDLLLPRQVGGEGLSGWTVRRQLVRRMAREGLPATARRIGGVHVQLRGVLPQLVAQWAVPASNLAAPSVFVRRVRAAAADLLPEMPSREPALAMELAAKGPAAKRPAPRAPNRLSPS